ncbi:DUF4214 domain-containing protein [Undibacterium sp. Di27W]|uniref:DUF4214 domain-containing protein n=1 Tax=Undibacterium sp. Di27W TaxID=3413036 RepID=UPI003BF32251
MFSILPKTAHMLKISLIFASVISLMGCGAGSADNSDPSTNIKSPPKQLQLQSPTTIAPILFSGTMSSYTITQTGTGYAVSDNVGTGGTQYVANNARLRFSDTSFTFDIDGNVGQVYRLYQAAFARKPDLVGFGYWIKDMDRGVSLTTVAASFFQSPEFQNRYGINPSTTTLINNFYQNVLHRAPDQIGFNYWTTQVNNGKITPEGVLASFSESPENKANVLNEIKGGISFAEYGVTYAVKPSSVVVTLAGGGNQGYVNGPGATARFLASNQITLDQNGALVVSDFSNLRRIALSGDVSAFAGVAGEGPFMPPIFLDGFGSAARFQNVDGLAVDKVGNVFVADSGNHSIRKVTPAGLVTTVAGNGLAGYQDGPALTARFYFPSGVAIDSKGNLYIAELTRVRKISTDGVVSTLAGNGMAGFADGVGVNASFDMESVGMAVDSLDNVYVSDRRNRRVRKITPTGNVTTFAGSGVNGMQDGDAATASFGGPEGLAWNMETGELYVVDAANHAVRRIANGQVTTVTGFSKAPGYLDGDVANAMFKFPSGITIDRKGNLYVVDRSNFRIRKICLATSLMNECSPVTAQSEYTLGGTITGLGAAPGLVLSNANQVLPITPNDTVFAFPTRFTQGASYAVTVLTQPAGMNCTIASGTGVITSTVTAVQVKCVPVLVSGVFSVGGSIYGLGAVSGLVLSDSGQTLAVAANSASFNFPATHPAGSSYAVGIVTQPTGYVCIPTASTGTVGAGNITSVTISCIRGDSSHYVQNSNSCLQYGRGLPYGNSGDNVTITNTCSFGLRVAYCNLLPQIVSDVSNEISSQFVCKQTQATYSPTGFVYGRSNFVLSAGEKVGLTGSQGTGNASYVFACRAYTETPPIAVIEAHIVGFNTLTLTTSSIANGICLVNR